MSDHRTCTEMHKTDMFGGNNNAMLLGYVLNENPNRQTLQSMLELGWLDIDTFKQALETVDWQNPLMFKNIVEIAEVLAVNFDYFAAFDVLKSFYNKIVSAYLSSPTVESILGNLCEVSAKIREVKPALYILIQSYFEERSEWLGLDALELLGVNQSLEI